MLSNIHILNQKYNLLKIASMANIKKKKVDALASYTRASVLLEFIYIFSYI